MSQKNKADLITGEISERQGNKFQEALGIHLWLTHPDFSCEGIVLVWFSSQWASNLILNSNYSFFTKGIQQSLYT